MLTMSEPLDAVLDIRFEENKTLVCYINSVAGQVGKFKHTKCVLQYTELTLWLYAPFSTTNS